jgi:3-hydroxyisobutyrate dehydrogenase-like beta-hydroxyacid dehydrogenase
VETIGIVGLGLLGHAVASRLIAAKYPVVGYDVVPERVRALTALGGRAAASVAEVDQLADAVCFILPSLASVEETILGLKEDRARGGRAVIQMSTISPVLTEKLARETAARGRRFLDCPISGTSAQVARGDGIVLVGGDQADFDRWRPVLEAVLPRAYYVGSAGQAMLLKLVANLLVGLHSLAAAEALSMARRGGLDPSRALEILTASAANSKMLEVRGPLIVREEFPPQMKLELFMKDLHLIQDAARVAGAPLPLTDVAERLYAAMNAAGHGGEDLAVVVKALG